MSPVLAGFLIGLGTGLLAFFGTLLFCGWYDGRGPR